MAVSRKERELSAPGTRIPPHSSEAEEAVLGGVLLDPKQLNLALERVKPEDFYRAGNAAIYEAMIALNERNEPVDLLTLSTELRSRGLLEQCGGIENLTRLSANTPSAANIGHYAKVVKDMSLRRAAISASSEIMNDAFRLETGIDEFLDRSERAILSIKDAKSGSSYVRVADILPESWHKIEERYDKKEKITGVASGYDKLDDITSGFQPSNLIILAARPSIGKTALALCFAQHAGVSLKKAVLLFSLEMSKSEIVMRMLCSEARVEGQKVKNGNLGDSDFPKLVGAASRIAESTVWIDDTPALTITDMRAKARRLNNENRLSLIIVDYLQLMRSPDQDYREQEISMISRSLKALAKELDVPVIALSQLNRSLETRENKRPILSDLRESGAIEQDADVIMFIYRDEFYYADSKDKGVAEVLISKHRNGPTGMVRLAFSPEYTRFDMLEERYESVPVIVHDHAAGADEPGEPF